MVSTPAAFLAVHTNVPLSSSYVRVMVNVLFVTGRRSAVKEWCVVTVMRFGIVENTGDAQVIVGCGKPADMQEMTVWER